MKKWKIDLNILGIILASLGAILSAILIFEYYGSLSDAFHSLCHTSGGDGCKAVAESEYSGFKNVPFFGEIPVALIGFTFYGFTGYLFYLSLASARKIEGIYHDLIFTVISMAVVADLVLLYVSVYKIGTICNLCLSTYGVTLFLFLIAIYQKRISSTREIEEDVENIATNKWNYAIAATSFFVIGLMLGKVANGSSSLASTNKNDQIAQLVMEFNKSPSMNIDLQNAPVVGDKNSPITIVKFHDYNCGHCMHTSKILNVIASSYTGIVKIAYKNFPLDGNCNRLVERKQPGASSCVAASASICADAQGKFKQVYEALFEDNEKGIMHTPATVIAIARNTGLDVAKFNQCMSSPRTADIISKDVNEGERLKIDSTPTLFVNDKKLVGGTPDVDYLKAIIDHLMK